MVEKAKIVKTKDGFWILEVMAMGSPAQWVASITPPEGRNRQMVLPPEVFRGLIQVKSTAMRVLRYQNAKAAADKRWQKEKVLA